MGKLIINHESGACNSSSKSIPQIAVAQSRVENRHNLLLNGNEEISQYFPISSDNIGIDQSGLL
jgi:hypothetical protein